MRHPLLFLLASTLASPLPLCLPTFSRQQALLPVDFTKSAHPFTQHLERIQKSAELLFTASDHDHMIHVWLPLNQRIFTRKYFSVMTPLESVAADVEDSKATIQSFHCIPDQRISST
jgi:hypothetical protein